MKALWIASVGAALAFFGGQATAQRGGQLSFEQLDTNHDGNLSKAEVEAMFAHRMGRGDRPDQGQDRGDRSGPEAGAGGMRRQRPDPDQIFARWDTNHDGVVSKEEFDARPRMGRGMRRGGPSGGDQDRTPPQG